MAGETTITIVGNLTADPELRNVGRGTVCNFTVASTPRQYNRQTGQWEDGQALFLNCSAWDGQYNRLASNIADSLAKGMRVIVQGTLGQRSYQARDGSQRTVVELHVTEAGPALSRASAAVDRQSGGRAQSQAQPVQPRQAQGAQGFGSFGSFSADDDGFDADSEAF